jgi:hypothetical protein
MYELIVAPSGIVYAQTAAVCTGALEDSQYQNCLACADGMLVEDSRAADDAGRANEAIDLTLVGVPSDTSIRADRC